MLVSAGSNCSGVITEGKEVTEWTAVSSSVSDVTEFVEYDFNRP